jgi:uncharacterized protein (DUF342 family)
MNREADINTANSVAEGEDITGPINSTAIIEISEDRMSAFLLITAPENGGGELTLEMAEEEAQISFINAPLDKQTIITAINTKVYGERILIAKGTRPINGLDGAVEFHFKTGGALVAKANERDEMDYKNLGLVTNIFAGTVIADIVFETDGEDGIDIRGNVLKPLPGKPAKFLVGHGTVLNDEGTKITAAVDGNLKWNKDHFTVEETLVLGEDVGAATGNIDFIGDVVIKGNVFEGFSVKSHKNVSIGGTVNNAEIEAGGSIEIKIGSVNSQLTSKGDIKSGFCENSQIHCGGDLISNSYVSCTAHSEGTITAISGRGIVIGGKLTAIKGMVFNTVGSGSYTKTSLTLGRGALLAKERQELEIQEAEITERINQHILLAESLNALKKRAGGLPRDREEKLASSIRGRFQLSAEVKKIKKRVAEIESSFLDNNSLFVEIRKTIYPGVSVRIGEQRLKPEKEWDRCRIAIGNSGEIEINPISGKM